MKLKLFLLSVIIMAIIQPVISENEIPKFSDRSEIPDQLKWDLSSIYTNWEDWESDLTRLTETYDKMAAMKGSLNEDPGNLIRFLELQEEGGKIGVKLYCYPFLFRSIDSRDVTANERYQQVNALMAGLATKVSWVSPELLEIPEDKMQSWIEEYEALQPFGFNLMRMYRSKKFVLDTDTETILSYFSLARSAPESIYTELSTSDIKRKEITLSDGSSVSMTPANYGQVVTYNKNRSDRAAAYEGFLEPYVAYENTYAAILNAIYQADWAAVKARGYTSFLQASLYGNAIPEEVYKNLIGTARSNTNPLQRYLVLRKKALGYEDYHPWDGSISITDFERKYPYDEAVKLVKQAVKPLGDDYLAEIDNCFAGGRIDVYETPGKTSGAFNMGVYGVHPYVLMNFNGTMDNVFTLAHELGHSLHSIFSGQNQPYSTAHYSSFVAEVASTFNEHLLLDYMLQNSDDPLERIALLNQAIGNITATFYRQSQFADFELQVRSLVEEGKPVNAKVLNEIMGSLNSDYFGEAVVPNDLSQRTWAYVMHFFELKYYVYQYATSYAASAHLFDKISNSSPEVQKKAVEQYINLLKSGGNDFPIEQLKKAGVDMTDPEVIASVANRLEQLVNQLENELIAIGRI